MGKSLKNLLYASSIIFALASLPGCEKNSPPEAKLEINPTSGDAPLKVRIKLTGEDPDGIEDIQEYRVNINSEIVESKSPLDLTRTFQNPGIISIYGEVFDSESESDKTPTISVEVSQGPFIEQSAALNNDVEIKYSATLSKVNKAELKVNKGGNTILTQEITDNSQAGKDFENIFAYNSSDGKFTKGEYEFVLKSENLEKKNSVSIPNYKPTANFSGINLDLMGNSEISTTLPSIDDKNLEDKNQVAYQSVKSLDGKTNPALDGNNLRIKPVQNINTNYQIEIEFGSEIGGLEKAVLNGNITADTRILVDPFHATNENGRIYNSFTTREQRDNLFQADLDDDWADADHIPYNKDPEWDCQERGTQTIINFYGFPSLTGYSGFNIDSIYHYKYTLKDNGKYGLPVYTVSLINSKLNYWHSMIGMITGDIANGDITNFDNWNFGEPQDDAINVKPGQYYMAEDFNMIIYHTYILENETQGKFINYTPILEFEVKNKVPRFIWKNPDPYLNIITQRK